MRRAEPADSAVIAEVMAASAQELSEGFYTAAQIPSVISHIAILDPVLIEVQTYFAIEDVLDEEHGGGPRVVACGGWSRRDKLFTGGGAAAGGTGFLVPGRDPARVRAMYTHPWAARRGFARAILEARERDRLAEGFTVVELMATAPGEPLYLACGYEILERVDVVLPDGCVVGCARMRKHLPAAP